MVTGTARRCTGGWIGAANRDDMLSVAFALLVVQMPLLQVIDMALMLDRQMSTLLAMNMWLAGVGRMLHNSFFL